jgi:hypothetical protein
MYGQGFQMASIPNQKLKHVLIPNLIGRQSSTPTTSPTTPTTSMASNESQQDYAYNGLFVHTMDGLSSSPPKQPYIYKICEQRAPKDPRKLGVPRKDKLSFEAVEEIKDRRIYSRNCLQSIWNLKIISLRYQAWVAKVTRIMQGG